MDNLPGNLIDETWSITPEILNLISEIDEFKGIWQAGKLLAKSRLLALKKIATIESIGSSTRIEGSKLQDADVEKLLSGSNVKTLLTRDEQEVSGYAFACDQIYEHFASISFSENSIKQIHFWLLKFCEKDERHRGKYKSIPIRIEAFDSDGKSAGVIFETTSPHETPIQMHELIDWANHHFATRSQHPLLIIAVFIVVFLAIHPFQDGNGRLARLITSFLMLKSGYLYVPYSSLESIIEANKEAYYLALQKTQKSWQNGKPDWNVWILFFLNALKSQKTHLEVKLRQETLLLKQLTDLQIEILTVIKSHGQLKISEIEILTQANRNTIKKSLSVLCERNLLFKGGTGKATWYTLA